MDEGRTHIDTTARPAAWSGATPNRVSTATTRPARLDADQYDLHASSARRRFVGCGFHGCGCFRLLLCPEDPWADCVRAEAAAYPEVEAVATEAMAEVPNTRTSRQGSCEDTGQPRAPVVISVPSWSTRGAAIRFLQEHRDFTFDDQQVSGRSPDGRFAVQMIRVWKNKHVVARIEVHFSKVSS